MQSVFDDTGFQEKSKLFQEKGVKGIKETRTAPSWFKLDNAAKIYPSVRTENWSSMYRVSFTLDTPIDEALLQKAVADVLPRFPNFTARLRRGFFWFYFEYNDRPLDVSKEQGHPLMPIRSKENNYHLFRILYYDCRISLEAFHSLADGGGAMVFMKTLVARYLYYLGVEVKCEDGVKSIFDMATPGEMEDAHARLPIKGALLSRAEQKAFQLPGRREMAHTLHVIRGRMEAQAVISKAKEMGVTVTEYMVGVFAFCLLQIQKEGKHDMKRPVKVSVPVNMRRFLKTDTLRNFSFYTNVAVDPRFGEYTFPEVVNLVHHYLRYATNEKFLFAGMATNVASEQSWFVRAVPLFLKNIIMGAYYRKFGEALCTTTISNLGRITFPKEMAEHITDVQVFLGPGMRGRSHASMVSFGDSLCLYFSRNLKAPLLEREVFRFLVKQGIHVTITGNQE
jgi:Uncharacterized protein containing a NRPS condensation (elongation) domain